MTAFTLPKDGRFSLAPTAAFLAIFPPLTTWQFTDSTLELAFLDDNDHQPVLVRLTETETTLAGAVTTQADNTNISQQVARFLYLHHSEDAFRQAATKDRVLQQVYETAPYTRPVCFFSPYEAAIWSILSTRTPCARALQLRERLSTSYGQSFTTEQGTHYALPPNPESLLDVTHVPGIPQEKIARLHSVAEAARNGILNPEYLLSLDPQVALTALKTIRGIGDFYAELIYARSLAPANFLPEHEPRVRKATGTVYQNGASVNPQRLREIARNWEPYRTWACFLLRTTQLKGVSQ